MNNNNNKKKEWNFFTVTKLCCCCCCFCIFNLPRKCFHVCKHKHSRCSWPKEFPSFFYVQKFKKWMNEISMPNAKTWICCLNFASRCIFLFLFLFFFAIIFFLFTDKHSFGNDQLKINCVEGCESEKNVFFFHFCWI